MTFPTINVRATNTSVPDSLKTLLDQKLASLEKHLGSETDITCDAEFEKIAPHEKGPIHKLTVNLLVAGDMHRATATKESFTESIDAVRDELDNELRRKNEKHTTLVKKGGRKIKEAMRFGE